jgi:hypothetical protein
MLPTVTVTVSMKSNRALDITIKYRPMTCDLNCCVAANQVRSLLLNAGALVKLQVVVNILELEGAN